MSFSQVLLACCNFTSYTQFMTALLMWALPMALWPFRTLLLPNADEGKKRLGSSPPPDEASEKISPVVIEEGELKEAFSKVIAPRGIMIFALLDIGFVSATT